MTEKFTLRDILVYTLLGLILFLFCFLYFPFEIISTISDFKDYSDLTVLLLVPFSYLIGHLLMSLDDIIFNGILIRFFPKDNPLKNRYWKFYNNIFFGYRNIGIRNKEKITNEIFLKTCDELISENKYEKAEYYQVMSDLFKGFFLILFITITTDLLYVEFKLWKFILLLLVWYRAKMFSSYYVRIIKRNIKQVENL